MYLEERNGIINGGVNDGKFIILDSTDSMQMRDELKCCVVDHLSSDLPIKGESVRLFNYLKRYHRFGGREWYEWELVK